MGERDKLATTEARQLARQLATAPLPERAEAPIQPGDLRGMELGVGFDAARAPLTLEIARQLLPAVQALLNCPHEGFEVHAVWVICIKCGACKNTLSGLWGQPPLVRAIAEVLK